MVFDVFFIEASKTADEKVDPILSTGIAGIDVGLVNCDKIESRR